MGVYKPVRSIGRGLEVLAAVGQNPGAPIARLSSLTGIHRTTVYRLLETLENLGYVRRQVCDDSYFVTHKALNLASTCTSDTPILDAASHYLRELIDEVDWPASVAMMDGRSMTIRDTTHGRSRIFVHDASIGTRMPVLTSASGRSYLAFCDRDQRAEIIEALARSELPERRLAQDTAYLDRVLGEASDKGYAVSIGESRSWLTCLAVPLLRNGSAVASVNMVVLTSALRSIKVEQFLPVLRDTVARIERDLSSDPSAPHLN